MKIDKKELIPWILIVIMFIIAFYFYPVIPTNEEGKVAIHWGPSGEADGYGSKFIGLFLIPIIITGLYFLLHFIPKIAVYKKNIQHFYKYYYGIKVGFILFFIVLYISTIVQAYKPFNMSLFILPAISVLFFYVGYIMQFVKKNYFIGIRTPWTLASEKVWDEIHKLGSKLFMISALIMFSSIFFHKLFILFILIPVLGSVLFLFVYSYVLYKKEKGMK